MRGRIATRNGEPAYVNAPPRLRQSQVRRDVQPLEVNKPGLIARLRQRIAGKEG